MVTWSPSVSLSIRLSRLSEFPNRTLLRDNCDVLEIDFAFRTELHGALSPALCEFPKLWHLDLQETKVSGDLATLARCKALQLLDLSETNVAGDVKVVENLVELHSLFLSDTKVDGNIEALHNLTELVYLYLSNTKVEGNLEALHELTKLHRLCLENTNVSGDMASLREAKGLDDVRITGSRITGGRCSSHLSLFFCLVQLRAPAPCLIRVWLTHGRHQMLARRGAAPAGAAWSGLQRRSARQSA